MPLLLGEDISDFQGLLKNPRGSGLEEPFGSATLSFHVLQNGETEAQRGQSTCPR